MGHVYWKLELHLDLSDFITLYGEISYLNLIKYIRVNEAVHILVSNFLIFFVSNIWHNVQ